MSVRDAGTSFIAGKLDVAELWEPFLSKAVNEGKGNKLVTSKKYPGLIADLFVMREEITKERPEDVQKIAAAWFDALEYFKENKEESIEIIAKRAEITPEQLKLGLQGFEFFSVKQNLEAYKQGDTYKSLHYTGKQNAEFLKDQNFIDQVPELNGLLNDSFVQKLAEEK